MDDFLLNVSYVNEFLSSYGNSVQLMARCQNETEVDEKKKSTKIQFTRRLSINKTNCFTFCIETAKSKSMQKLEEPENKESATSNHDEEVQGVEVFHEDIFRVIMSFQNVAEQHVSSQVSCAARRAFIKTYQYKNNIHVDSNDERTALNFLINYLVSANLLPKNKSSTMIWWICGLIFVCITVYNYNAKSTFQFIDHTLWHACVWGVIGFVGNVLYVVVMEKKDQDRFKKQANSPGSKLIFKNLKQR